MIDSSQGSRSTEERSAAQVYRPAVVSFLLVVLNAIVFVAVTWDLDNSAEFLPALLDAGALERSRVWDGEVWRLVSATFLHGGWFHLAFNLVLIYVVAGNIERSLGSLTLALVYLVSAVGGSAASLLGHDGPSVGASGAAFGLVGFLLALAAEEARRGRPSNLGWIGLRIAVVVIFFVAFEALVGAPDGGGVDHWAHLGGFLTGFAFGLARSFRASSHRAIQWGVTVAFACLFLAFVGASLVRWPGMEAEIGIRETYGPFRIVIESGDVAAARGYLKRAKRYGLDGERSRRWEAAIARAEARRNPVLDIGPWSPVEPAVSERPALSDDAARILRLDEEVRTLEHAARSRDARARAELERAHDGASERAHAQEGPDRDSADELRELFRKLLIDGPATMRDDETIEASEREDSQTERSPRAEER